MNGYIYKITNTGNGKIYIGLTDNPGRRWKQHIDGAKTGKVSNLYKAMRTEGYENFSFEIIEECHASEMGMLEGFYCRY